MTDFNTLSREQLEDMADAANRIVDCYRVLQKSGDNVVGEILKGQGEFYEWDHYPDGDVYDPETHSQYYYHAHREGEHGHFHTFLRPKGMPKGVKPLKVKDYEKKKDPNDELSHLIAISMDRAGFPISLFTTNRWVTGETWYQADDVIRMLDKFNMDLSYPSWPTNVWITCVVRLFRPQIEALIKKRDEAIEEWQNKKPGENIFEDRDFEIAALEEISVEGQIEKINAALAAK